MVKCPLHHEADINTRNLEIGETFLKWAVKGGPVAITELLLRCGANSSVLDLGMAERREQVGEEELDIYNALVKRPKCTSVIRFSPRRCVTTVHNWRRCGQDKGRTKSPEPSRTSILARRSRCQVSIVPDESGAEEFIAQRSRYIECHGVPCDGPLCKRAAATSILGTRFKCTVCEAIDFCAECTASFRNQPDAGHVMVRCLLPTEFRMIQDVDKIAKQGLLQQRGRSWSELDDLIHVVYAETQQN